ncbi:MAG: YciI family protein [Acidimicrobiia bacterium]
MADRMDSPTLSTFMYVFGPGPRPEMASDPDSWTDDDRAIGARHYAYLSHATATGTVLLAGRCTDGAGPAVVIFDAESPDDAHDFMAGDPFIAEGLFTASLHEFNASLVRSPG